MEEWKEYKLGDLIALNSGGTPDKNNKSYWEGNIPWISAKYMYDDYLYSSELKISQEGLANGSRLAPKGSILLLTRGSGLFNRIPVCYTMRDLAYNQDVKCIESSDKELVSTEFLFYWLMGNKDSISAILETTGIGAGKIDTNRLKNIRILLPSKEYQQALIDFSKSLMHKIEVNRRINDNFYYAFFEVMLIWLLTSHENDNLEQQAMAIFDKMFPAIASGEDTIGSMITPKRGKGLLSKDAIEGNVPVVAGGLEPATYHNESNTVAPVVTISASGANAGYVNLWPIPVWSSDSSFIDATMTSNVYFWYVMLKKRQKEIFDAQTGSAQPHIYPKHVAEMPLGKFEQSEIEKFTEIVTPMFEIRGKNLKESERLAAVRDSLLPKLMSGELNLDKVNV